MCKKQFFFGGALVALFLTQICSFEVLADTQAKPPVITPAASPVTANKLNMLIFSSDGCPHCHKVAKYICQNRKALNKVAIIEEKEIHDSKNHNILLSSLDKCGIKQHVVDLPILAMGEKCITGDQPIIDFLSGLINKGTDTHEKTIPEASK